MDLKDYPTPRELLRVKIIDSFAKNQEELQQYVGDNFFLEVVDSVFEVPYHRYTLQCVSATFRVPGSDFLIKFDSYDLMEK